jgi:hypothetical protein
MNGDTPDFVRDPAGNVIGIAFDEHPDVASDQPTGFMIPVAAIPEGSQVGALPDPLVAADDLASANAKIAELEAQIAAGNPPPPAP